MELERDIKEFLSCIPTGDIEVYNEFSLQHELGIFLRNRLPAHRVQFERNVCYFNLRKSEFEKREIDIVVMPADSNLPQSAVELKYPRNGQVPEQMFSFCKDIAFLEQLVAHGFGSAYFLALAGNRQFYSGKTEGIYGMFRGDKTITGTITKPTGAKDKFVQVSGRYNAVWQPVSGSLQYCLLRVGS